MALLRPGCCSGVHRVRSRHRTFTLHWLVAWFVLLCVSSCRQVTAQAGLVEYNCVYTNSTKKCSLICPQGCFYTLLPTVCSEDGQMLKYSIDSRPDSTELAVQFNDTYSVPQTFINQLPLDLFNMSSSFTIALWFKPLEQNNRSKVLIQFQISSTNTHLIIYLNSEWLYITDTLESINTTANIPIDLSQWHHLTFSIENNFSYTNITTFINGSFIGTSTFSTVFFSNERPDVYLAGLNMEASGFSNESNTDYSFHCLMQDVGLFSRPLTDIEAGVLAGGRVSLSGARFLPQCLCSADVSVNTTNSQLCEDGTVRYNVNSNAVEFITDNNLATFWQSNRDDATIAVTLGLQVETSLSKVFIKFKNATPGALSLQYLSQNVWLDIQYYAINCIASFGKKAGQNVSNISDVICEEIQSFTTALAFYIVANERNLFPSEELKNTFLASQIRLVLSNNSDQTFELEEVQVCSDFDSNLNLQSECFTVSSSSTITLVSITPTSTITVISSTLMSSIESSSIIEESILDIVPSSTVVLIESSILTSVVQSIEMSPSSSNEDIFTTLSQSSETTSTNNIETTPLLFVSTSNEPVEVTSSQNEQIVSSINNMLSSQYSDLPVISSSTEEPTSLLVKPSSPLSLVETSLVEGQTSSITITQIKESSSIFIEESPSPSIIEQQTSSGIIVTSVESNQMEETSSLILEISSSPLATQSSILKEQTSSVIEVSSTTSSQVEQTSSPIVEISSPLAAESSILEEQTSTIIEVSSTTSSQVEETSSPIVEISSPLAAESSILEEQTSTIIEVSSTTSSHVEQTSSPIVEMSSPLAAESSILEEQTSTLIEVSSTTSSQVEETSSPIVEMSSPLAAESSILEEQTSTLIEVSSTTSSQVEETSSPIVEVSSPLAAESSILEEQTSTLIEVSSTTSRELLSLFVEPSSTLSIIEQQSTLSIEPTPVESSQIEGVSSIFSDVSPSPSIIEDQTISIIVTTTSLLQSIEGSSTIEVPISTLLSLAPSTTSEETPESSAQIELTSITSFSIEMTETLSSSEVVLFSSIVEVPTESSHFVEASSVEISGTDLVLESSEISLTTTAELSSSEEVFVTPFSTQLATSSVSGFTTTFELLSPSPSFIEVPESSIIEEVSSSVVELTSTEEFITSSSQATPSLTSLLISTELVMLSSTQEFVEESSEILLSSSVLIQPSSTVESILTPESSIISEVSFEAEPTSSAELTEPFSTLVSESSYVIVVVSSSELGVLSSELVESTSSQLLQLSSEIVEPESSEVLLISSTLLLELSSSILETSPEPTSEIIASSSEIVESSSEIIEPTLSEILESSEITLESSSQILESSLEINEPTLSMIVESSSEVVEPTPEPSSNILESPTEIIEPTSSEILESSTTLIIEPTSPSEILESSTEILIELTTSEIFESSTALIIEPTSSSVILESSTEIVIEPTPSEILESSTTLIIESTSPSEILELSTEIVIEPTPSEILESSTEVVIEPTPSEILESSTEIVIEPTLSEILESSTEIVIEPTPSEILESSTEVVIEPTPSEILESSTEIVIEPTLSEILESSTEIVIEPTPSEILESSTEVVIEPTLSEILESSTEVVIEPTPSEILESSTEIVIEPTPSEILESSTEIVIEPTPSEILESSTEIVIEPTPSEILESSTEIVIEPTPSEILESSTEVVIEPTPSEILESSTEVVIEPTPSEILESSTEIVIEPTPSEILESSTEIVIEPTPSEIFESSTEIIIEPTPSEILESSTEIVIEPTSSEIFESSTEIVIEPTPSEILESSTEIVIEPTPSEILESSTEIVIEPTPSEILESSTEIVIEPTPSEIFESSTEIIIEPTPSEILESSTEIVIEPTPSEIFESSTEIVIEPTPSEILESSTEIVIEPTPSEILESSTEIVIEPTPSEILESSTEIVIEPTPSEILESSTEIVIEPTPSEIFESSTEIVIEPTSSEIFESSTEIVIEPTPSVILESSTEIVIEPTPSEIFESSSEFLVSSFFESPSPTIIIISSEEVFSSSEFEISSTEFFVSPSPSLEEEESSVVSIEETSLLLTTSSFEFESSLEVTPSPTELEISSSIEVEISTEFVTSSIFETSSFEFEPSSTIFGIETLSFSFSPSPSLEFSSSQVIELSPSPSFSSESVFEESSTVIEVFSSSFFELSPSLEVSSSLLPEFSSSLFISPSPSSSPSLVIFPSVSVTPTVLINGFGVLVEDSQQYENETQYNFKYGLFGAKVSDETFGTVKAQLGSFSSSEKVFTRQRQNLTTISGAFSTDTLWVDNPNLTLVLQARDEFSSTSIESTTILITAKHTSGATSNFTCHILNTTKSGICYVRVSLSTTWFSGGDSDVTFTAINEQVPVMSQFEIGSIKLSAKSNQVINKTLFMVLPQTPVLPGETASISIKSSYDYRVFGFNLDCIVSGGAEIVDPFSPLEYSLLFNYYREQTDRIAFSGFRNRDQFNTTPLNGSTELLVTFGISIPSEGTYSITCSVKGLSLSNREVIVPTEKDQTLPVQTFSRDQSTIGVIPNQVNDIVNIFPYSTHNLFLNLATVNDTLQYLGPISVSALYRNGTLAELDSPALACSSDDDEVVNVTTDCSNIYFNGYENKGTDTNITITLTNGNNNISAKLPVRVWRTNTNLTITVQDFVLNATSSCNNATYYQRSTVTVEGSVSHNKDTELIQLTLLLRHLIVVQNESVARIDANGDIVGIGPGTTTVFIKNMAYGYTEITVSDELARPEYMSLFVFSNIVVDLQAPQTTPEDIQIGTVRLFQDFNYQDQPVYINTLVVFEDGSTMNADSAPELMLLTDEQQVFEGQFLIQQDDNIIAPVVQGSWSQCPEAVAKGMIVVNVTLVPPLRIALNPTSTIITPLNDLLVLIDNVPASAIINVTAVYEETNFNRPISSSTINITGDISINDTSVIDIGMDDNGNLVVYPLQYGLATLSVYISEFNLTGTATFLVTESNFIVTLRPFPSYPHSNTVNVDTIQRIGMSNFYQQVMVETSLFILPNGTYKPVIDSIITLDNDTLLSLNGSVISVRNGLTVQEPTNVSVNAFVSNVTNSTLLTVKESSQNVSYVKLNFTSQFIAIAGSIQVADCLIILDDNTTLSRTFDDNGSPLYGNLVMITTSDSSVAKVIANTSKIQLLSTSRSNISITCTSGAVNHSMGVVCNTLPGNGEIDLGSNTGLPSESIVIYEIFVVPISLTSNVKIGVFEITLEYESSFVSYINAEQGNDWLNGSLVVANVEVGKLKIGGVLNGGVNDTALQLANIQFKALAEKSDTEFKATPTLLAEAILSLPNLLQNESSLTNVSLLVEIGTQSRRRRSIESEQELTRERRQTDNSPCPPYPIGDINGDCEIDLRDVYYFQEYNLASVHNFTGSDESQIIKQTIVNKSITLDVDGDGIITLDDIVLVEQIGSGLVYNLSATYSIVKEFCDCIVEINITVSTVDGLAVSTDNLHVFIHLAHNNAMFLDELNKTRLLVGSLEDTQINQGLYTAIIRANHSSSESNTNSIALFQMRAATSFTLNDIGISAIQAVGDSNGVITESRVAGLFGSQPLIEDESGVPFTISINAAENQVVTLTVDNLLPHFIINLTCPEDVPPPVPPSLPLRASTSGIGYLVGGLVQSDITNNLHYETNITLFTNAMLSRQGRLDVELGGLTQSFSFTRNLPKATSLRHPVASFNQAAKTVYATVQVFNEETYTFNTVSNEVNIKLQGDNDELMDTTCTPDIASGICQGLFKLASSTINSSTLTVLFSLIDNASINVTSKSLQVGRTPSWTIKDTMAIILPPYPLSPGSEFDIEVYANSTYPLISFLMELMLPDSANIISTINSNGLWGVRCTNRLCIGYRTNFQTLSTSISANTEHLFTATISIPNDYSEDEFPVSANIREMYNVFYEELVGTASNGVVLVNATGSFTSNAIIAIVGGSAIIDGFYAYTTQSELVNTAVLDKISVSVPITTVLLYSNGSLINSAKSLNCNVTIGNGAIQLLNDCSKVFVNGSETQGTDNANIALNLIDTSYSSTLQFRVWFPDLPVELHLGREILKGIITGAVSSSNCNQLYQTTELSAISKLTAGSTKVVYNVDLSQYVFPYVNVSPPGAVELNATSRTVKGLMPAIATLSSEIPDLVQSINLTVSNELVTVDYLYTVLLTNIDIHLQSEYSHTYHFSITLDPSFNHFNDIGDTTTIALFSDNSTMPVSDLVSVISLMSNVLNQTGPNNFAAVSNYSGDIIESEWTNQAKCSPERSCIKINTANLNITLPNPIELVVLLTPNSTLLAVSEAIGNITNLPYSLRILAKLQYPDGSTENVTQAVSTNPPLQMLEELTAADLNYQTGSVSFSYKMNRSSRVLTKTVDIEVVNVDNETSSIALRPYSNYSDSESQPDINELRSIEGTNVYQKAILSGTIKFTNGDNISLTELESSAYNFTIAPTTLISIDTELIVVIQTPPSNETTVVINLNLNGVSDNVALTDVILKPISDPISIINITWHINQLTGRLGAEKELDVSVTLAKNSGIIHSLRNFSGSNIATLIQFSSANSNIVSIDSATGLATLLQNSPCGIQLTASVKNNIAINSTFAATVTLLPESGGLEAGAPTLPINITDIINVPIYLNTNGLTVDAIEAVIVVNTSLLDIMNVSIEGTQWPGGVLFYNTEIVNESTLLTFGGLALNKGLNGDRVHLVNVYMKALSEGISIIYGYTTQYGRYGEISLPTNSNTNASLTYISISSNKNCQVVDLNDFVPVIYNTTCASGQLELAGNGSYQTCPITVNTSKTILYERLHETETQDLNLDGIGTSLDPLFTSQVSFDLLALLETYPNIIYSSRNKLDNTCNVTINTKLIKRNGQSASRVNLYILLDINSTTFADIFNSSTDPIYTNSANNRILIPTVYNENNEKHILTLNTILEEIPAGTLSISLVQVTGSDVSSPARVLPMVRNGSSQSIPLNITINGNHLLRLSHYSPLITFNDDIVCPPLPSPPTPTVNESTIVSGSRNFSFLFTEPIERSNYILNIYNCSRLLEPSCSMPFIMYENWIVIGNMATVKGLSPYTTYTFYIMSNLDGNIRSNEITVSTLEDQPTGFDTSNIIVISQDPTSITIQWSEPSEPNGRITRATVRYISSGTKRKRDNSGSNTLTYNGTYNGGSMNHTITGLDLASRYMITVEIHNSVGSISASIDTHTDLPPPILIPSKSNNFGCVNLTINQPYFVSGDLSYNITLTCLNESGMVSTSDTTSSNFSVEVCYDSVNGVQHNNFECTGIYTVNVIVSRNGFTNSVQKEVTIPILAPVSSPSLSIEGTPSFTETPSSFMESSSFIITPSSSIEVTSLFTETPSSSTESSSFIITPSSSIEVTSLFTETPSSSTESSSFILTLSSSIEVTSLFIETPSSSFETSSSFIETPSLSLIQTSFMSTATIVIESTSSSMESSTSQIEVITSVSSSTPSTNITTPTDGTGITTTTPIPGSSSPAAIIAGVMTIIVILLIIILIIVVFFIARNRVKKRGAMDFYHGTGSRASKDYWFEVEETVEMSPIDIVPVDHHPFLNRYIDETAMSSGIIENRGVYSSGDISREESLLSVKPLISHHKPQPRTGRSVTFTDHSETAPPPYHSDVSHTDQQYEGDSESLIDLQFSEDPVSQPYLSLGLTPLSQLSPDPLGSSGNQDLGFFPSMLPPVSPLTSVMTATGISVDTDNPSMHHHGGLDTLVMPDAMPSYSIPLHDSKKTRRQPRMDVKTESMNGSFSGSRILETVVEHQSLEADNVATNISGFSKGTSSNSHNSLHARHNMTSLMHQSASSSEDEMDMLVFPSATTESPLMTRNPRGALPKSSKVDFRDEFDDFFGGNYSRNKKPAQNGSTSPYSSRKPTYRETGFMNIDFVDIDPVGEDRQRRQQARDRAKAEQKVLLLEKRKEEEKKKQMKSRERQETIAKNYATFADIKQPARGTVLQQIARFDAEAELKDEELKKIKNSQSQELSPKVGGYPPGAVVSPQHRWSSRPRAASNDSMEMKITEDQITVL